MSGSACLAEGCGARVSRKWCKGPDGPATLCATCYGRFTAMRLPLYQDPVKPHRLSVRNGPGRRKMRITGFASKMTDGGVRRNLRIPYVTEAGVSAEDDGSGNSNAPIVARTVEATRAPPRSCARCDVRSTPQWADGPDGADSLCMACGARYKQAKCFLYRNLVDQRVTAKVVPHWEKVETVGFSRVGGKQDLTKPIVRAVINGASDSASEIKGTTLDASMREQLCENGVITGESAVGPLAFTDGERLDCTTRRYISKVELEEAERVRRLEAQKFYKSREDRRREKRKKFEEERKRWLIKKFNIQDETPTPDILRRMKEAGIPPLDWSTKLSKSDEMSSTSVKKTPYATNIGGHSNRTVGNTPRSHVAANATDFVPMEVDSKQTENASRNQRHSDTLRNAVHSEESTPQSMHVRLHWQGRVIIRQVPLNVSFEQLCNIVEKAFAIDMQHHIFVHVDEEGLKMQLRDITDLLDVFENIPPNQKSECACMLHVKPLRKRRREW